MKGGAYQMTRDRKIRILLDNTDRKDLELYEYFLNQCTDKRLDDMIANLTKQMSHEMMEANFC